MDEKLDDLLKKFLKKELKNPVNLKEDLSEQTTLWAANLNLILPIDEKEISNFKEWVNWSGWKGYSPNHNAYDFAAYLTNDGDCILGLPQETSVYAIADGLVAQVSSGLAGNSVPYATFINIEHARQGNGLFSSYHHVVPLVKQGTYVKKGDKIASLYKDEGNEEGKFLNSQIFRQY